MNSIILAASAVSAIGLLCAAILAAASKIMGVSVDLRIEQIRECLPGANCGACGFAGCDSYASALAADTGVATNLCIPGGDGTSGHISEILGVAFEDVIEHVALVKCGGNKSVTSGKMEYEGIQSCAAAKMLYGGQGACSYGCLGFGDCARACPNGAINVRDGVAFVSTAMCHGCGICAKECPKNIIDIVPAAENAVVLCSSESRGAETRAACKSGCIACGKCVKECPVQAITVTDNLARIDGGKCTACGKCDEICVAKCIYISAIKICPPEMANVKNIKQKSL